MERRPTASFEPMNDPDPRWVETTRAVQRDLDRSAAYQLAVREAELEDIMKGRLEAPPPTQYGWGKGMLGVQDGGGAIMDAQLVDATVEDVTQHIREATKCRHPAQTDTQGGDKEGDFKARVTRELRAAVEFSTGHEDMKGEFARRSAVQQRIAASLVDLSNELRAKYSPQHVRCAYFEPINVAYVAAMTNALRLPDTDLAMRLLLGAKVAGDLPATKAWDARFKPGSLGMRFEDLPHGQWNEWLHGDIERRATRSGQARETAEIIRARTASEIDAGLSDGYWEKEDLDERYGVNGWRALRRFAVPQADKIRVCDDAKESLVNAGSNTRDKLRLVEADFPARMAKLYAEAIGESSGGLDLIHGTEDIAAAYRKVPSDSMAFTTIAMYNTRALPRPGEEPNGQGFCPRVQYVQMPGMPFGLTSSVTTFCSAATFAAHCARRLLAATTEGFVDDFSIVGMAAWDDAPQRAMVKLMRAIGLPFSGEKHERMAPINVFCGVISDFTRLRKEGIVMVYVSQKRKNKLRIDLERARSGLTPKAARRLVGKLGFTLCWSFGRVGRAALQPLQARADSDADESFVDWALLRSINFLSAIVARLPRRTIKVEHDAEGRMPICVWSDARYEADAEDPAEGGFIIYVPGEDGEEDEWIACTHVTPTEVVGAWEYRKQYIGQLEILYAVAPYFTVPEVFAGREVLHFIDNTSACAALIKGYSRAIDSGLIVNAFHAFNVGIQADVWFEYVRSKANIADFPSRDAWEELWQAFESVGVDNRKVRWVECELPPIFSLQAPAHAWIGAAEARLEGEPYDRPDDWESFRFRQADARAEKETGASVERADDHIYYARRWVRDARFHEYDEYVGSPHEPIPKGVDAAIVERRARRYGYPQAGRGESSMERERVIRDHMFTILRSKRTVRFIREELRGRRLAGTNGGLPSTVDNLAEIANCREERLDKLYSLHGL